MLWIKQTPWLQKQPIGRDAENWITGLVDMSHIMDFPSGNSHFDPHKEFPSGNRHIDPHKVRPRRQAGRTDQSRSFQSERGQTGRRQQTLRRQPRVRKEYRMLTERERFMFHRAINMLKADTVSNKSRAIEFFKRSLQRAALQRLYCILLHLIDLDTSFYVKSQGINKILH
jgi:hypothetical protein